MVNKTLNNKYSVWRPGNSEIFPVFLDFGSQPLPAFRSKDKRKMHAYKLIQCMAGAILEQTCQNRSIAMEDWCV